MEHEMNFFDLCVACGHAIGRGCKAFGHILAQMLRLTYRYWWLVLTILAFAVACAFYYARPENLTYKMNAIALLNGASIQQFEQAYAPLRSGRMLPDEAAITSFIHNHKAKQFETFRVIDCLNNETADYIDFKHKSVPTDTMNVQMDDRLCLQFRIKASDLYLVPEIENALLAWLNRDEAMQQSYQIYLANLQEAATFNHVQAQKLDSLTSHYYFRGHLGKDSFGQMREGTVVMSDWGGDWKVRLFLDDIYEQQKHMQLVDYRLQLAGAPIVLENHFAAAPVPVNELKKCLILFLILGWVLGCAIAEAVDKRKVIHAWLKQ